MSDPATLTIASIGATVVVEGIKFLYGQAGELLKRLSNRKPDDNADEEPFITVTMELPAALQGGAISADISAVELAAEADRLRALRATLADHATGLRPLGPAEPQVLADASALRATLERLLGRQISFQGEDRPPSGTPVVRGRVEVGENSGDAAGVSVDEMRRGIAEGEAKANQVARGGTLSGVRARTIG